MLVEHRTQIVAAAHWGAAHEPLIHYTQDYRRDDFLHLPQHQLPMWTDCSGFVSWCYWITGAPNPGGNDWSVIGDTVALAKHAHGEVGLPKVRPGDLCILGLEGPHSNHHVVIVADVTNPRDPIVISHGSEGGPRVLPLSYDRRSHRFFQYVTTSKAA